MQQSSNDVLMIRPRAFGSNPETLQTNEFQQKDLADQDALQEQALAEFDSVVDTLRKNGINVVVADDTETPLKPDAVFPNNWLTTDETGLCVLYPMQPVSRRAERRLEVVHALAEKFEVKRVSDWSDYEHSGKFLEGTGSLVLDRVNCRAYACLSERTHEELVRKFCDVCSYEAITFNAVGSSGRPIYHTNVMMCIGTKFSLVCADAIPDKSQRTGVMENLGANRDVITISIAQMEQFAGNMLEVTDDHGDHLLLMSARAHASLSEKQLTRLGSYARIVPCSVDRIEDASGGSVRCMLAEIFLPSRKNR